MLGHNPSSGLKLRAPLTAHARNGNRPASEKTGRHSQWQSQKLTIADGCEGGREHNALDAGIPGSSQGAQRALHRRFDLLTQTRMSATHHAPMSATHRNWCAHAAIWNGASDEIITQCYMLDVKAPRRQQRQQGSSARHIWRSMRHMEVTTSSSVKPPCAGSGDATCSTYSQPAAACAHPASDMRSASTKLSLSPVSAQRYGLGAQLRVLRRRITCHQL